MGVQTKCRGKVLLVIEHKQIYNCLDQSKESRSTKSEGMRLSGDTERVSFAPVMCHIWPKLQHGTSPLYPPPILLVDCKTKVSVSNVMLDQGMCLVYFSSDF